MDNSRSHREFRWQLLPEGRVGMDNRVWLRGLGDVCWRAYGPGRWRAFPCPHLKIHIRARGGICA